MICTWFVFPEDARGEPTATATATPIPVVTLDGAKPTASAPPKTGGSRPITALPNTGVGGHRQSGDLVAAAMLAVIALGSVGLGVARRRS